MQILTVRYVPNREFILTSSKSDNPGKLELIGLLGIDGANPSNTEIRIQYKTDDEEELSKELSNFAKEYENNNYFKGVVLLDKPPKKAKKKKSSKKSTKSKKTSTTKSATLKNPPTGSGSSTMLSEENGF